MTNRDIIYITRNYDARHVVAKYAGHHGNDYVEHEVNSANQTLKTTLINERDLPESVVAELVLTKDRCFNQVKLAFDWNKS